MMGCCWIVQLLDRMGQLLQIPRCLHTYSLLQLRKGIYQHTMYLFMFLYTSILVVSRSRDLSVVACGVDQSAGALSSSYSLGGETSGRKFWGGFFEIHHIDSFFQLWEVVGDYMDLFSSLMIDWLSSPLFTVSRFCVVWPHGHSNVIMSVLSCP